ncbi:PilZ domain-containing protein [Candidatus Omnitrophota bacterium]
MKREFDFLREKRRYRRLNRPFGVNIVSVKKRRTLPKLDHEVGLNISLEGILIKCERILRKNTAVGLKMMLVKDGAYRTLETKGTVAWNKASPGKKATYLIGIHFRKLPLKYKRVISWFFRK